MEQSELYHSSVQKCIKKREHAIFLDATWFTLKIRLTANIKIIRVKKITVQFMRLQLHLFKRQYVRKT